jgi:hypothetical protein
MANNIGTLVPDSVRPISDQDTYPVAFNSELKGGFKIVSTTTERDAIFAERREVGMLVKVLADGITYRLNSGLTNSDWIVDSLPVEYVANYASISNSTNKRFILVQQDEMNNGNDSGLYLFDGVKINEILLL